MSEYIDPISLAERRGELKGRLSLDSFDRLSELLFCNNGRVEVELVFSKEDKIAKIEGKIKTNLALKCQNCLEALDWPVNIAIKLGIVSTLEQADRLPDEFEPFLIDEDRVLVKDLIEDELLLILPPFPKHQHNCLNQVLSVVNLAPLVTAKKQVTHNPFSILSKLKKTGDTNGSTEE
ncbi:MAG: YceD family protein [Methylococcaceae bacterium]